MSSGTGAAEWAGAGPGDADGFGRGGWGATVAAAESVSGALSTAVAALEAPGAVADGAALAEGALGAAGGTTDGAVAVAVAAEGAPSLAADVWARDEDVSHTPIAAATAPIAPMKIHGAGRRRPRVPAAPGGGSDVGRRGREAFEMTAEPMLVPLDGV